MPALFSIVFQYSVLAISLRARAWLGLKSDIFQPKLQMWYHQLFDSPTGSWGRGRRITELLQGKSNLPANPNTQSGEPGLSSAGAELVSRWFNKRRRKVCRETIRRYPQPRGIKQFSSGWKNAANYTLDFRSVLISQTPSTVLTHSPPIPSKLTRGECLSPVIRVQKSL